MQTEIETIPFTELIGHKLDSRQKVVPLFFELFWADFILC